MALVGATLIDGTGGPPLADAAVLVRRGKVESIGPRSGFELPRGVNQVDVSGHWIIPGLIDAHAHLAQAAGWAPARYLAWGVTTVRDMHGPLNSVISVRRRSNTPSNGSPRMYAAGAMIDGLPTTYPDAIGVNSEQDARKAVDRLVSAGVDFIKVYTHIDPPLLRAILDEAHTFNIAVAAHLGMTDALAAAKDGISSIEHLTGVPEAISRERSSLLAAHYRGFFPGWTAFERRWADLDSAALSQLAGRMAQERVTLVPTLILHETLSRLDDPADPPGFRSPGGSGRCQTRVGRAGDDQPGPDGTRPTSPRSGSLGRCKISSSVPSSRPGEGSPPEPTLPTSFWFRVIVSTASSSCWLPPASARGRRSGQRPGTLQCCWASIP